MSAGLKPSRGHRPAARVVWRVGLPGPSWGLERTSRVTCVGRAIGGPREPVLPAWLRQPVAPGVAYSGRLCPGCVGHPHGESPDTLLRAWLSSWASLLWPGQGWASVSTLSMDAPSRIG